MLAVPLNDTPPIVLAVCSAVAVPALPDTLPVTSPVRLPVASPVRLAVNEETPDIAVAYTVPPK